MSRCSRRCSKRSRRDCRESPPTLAGVECFNHSGASSARWCPGVPSTRRYPRPCSKPGRRTPLAGTDGRRPVVHHDPVRTRSVATRTLRCRAGAAPTILHP